MKPKRDVKFIIYQSLYIFVICVVAMKGANLDLTQVIEGDDNKIAIEKEKLKNLIDTSNQDLVILTREDYEKLEPKKDVVVNPPIVIMNTTPTMGSFSTGPYTEKPPEEKPKEAPVITERKEEVVVGNLTLYQYHVNSINNQGDAPITVKGVTIPPHSTASVTLGGESSVIISSGSVTKTVQVNENRKPDVRLQQLVDANNEDNYLSKLQKVVGYRVTILDDFTEQLDIKITGAVTTKVAKQTGNEIVIDVTLNAFGSGGEFNAFKSRSSESVFTSSFTVTVKDKLAPHTVSRYGSFKYSDWAE